MWECFFLLCCLRILLHKYFPRRWDLWVWLGIAGGFAYYAKAYSLPFFILNTIFCVFVATGAQERDNRPRWLLVSAVAIGVMFLIAFPWIYLLHEKYGVWMTSTAGTLNLSWYPVGHPFYKEGIEYLLPPVYDDSPSYWEDPWLVNGETPHFWDSGYFFMRQVVRIGYNLLLLVKCLNEISPFLLPVAGLGIAIVLSKKVRNYFDQKHALLALSFLLFPLGFLPINYEARYMWYMLLPGLVLGASALQRIYRAADSKVVSYLAIIIFSFSFLAHPLWDMKQMFREGEREYILAQEIKKLGIRGSFTANVSFTGDGAALQSVTRLAYFSGNPYYNIPYPVADFDKVLQDARRYRVGYLFYYTDIPGAVILRDKNGDKLPEVASFSHFKVFRLYP